MDLKNEWKIEKETAKRNDWLKKIIVKPDKKERKILIERKQWND